MTATTGDFSLPARYLRGKVSVAIDADAYLSTVEVAELTGLTYRQLNFLAGKYHWNPGYGTRRQWSHNQVIRLRIAAAINEAAGNLAGHRASNLPLFARVVMDGPEPPDTGWVAYAHNSVAYGASPAVALKGLDGGLVTRIPAP